MREARVLAQLVPIGGAFEVAGLSDVQAIEHVIGAPLPGDYVNFLSKFGASMVSGEASCPLPEGEAALILTFFGAEKVLEDCRSHEDYVLGGYVPFADDFFNNRFVVHAASGAVFFIEYKSGAAVHMSVSPSFGEFLERIEVASDD